MNYGQKENPIKLFNIRQGLEYLNNLRCDNGDYIIYHRLGSTNLNGVVIIDIYEIYTSSHKLDKIYITYVDEWLTDLRPPTGYLFESPFLSDLTKLSGEYIFDDKDYSDEDGYLKQSLSESGGYNMTDSDFPLGVLDKLIDNYVVIGNKNKIVNEIISWRRDRKLDDIL
jgi:hypothetical protein